MYPLLDVRHLRNPILIISPHPDDDILSSGGLIQRALGLGKSIFVLYLTTGEGNVGSLKKFLHAPLEPESFIDLAQLRYEEAVKAAVYLGIPRKHLLFMCFPDKTYAIAKCSFPNKVFSSSRTLLRKASYSFALRKNARYSRGAAEQLIQTVLKRVKPGTIILNHSADTHRNHIAARKLVLSAVRGSSLQADIYSYLIHYPHWPSTAGKFNPPAQLSSSSIRRFALTASELGRKKKAFRMHKSQFSISFLDRSLVRSNEFFWIE